MAGDFTRKVKVSLTSDASGFNRGVKEAESAIDRLNSSFGRLGKAAAAIGVGYAVAQVVQEVGRALVTFTQQSTAAAREAELADNRLSNIFNSMGLSAQRLTKATQEASRLSAVIGVDDDDIKGVQALLATFKQASQDLTVYNRATALAFDLQAAGFGDAQSNAKQLGKALEDPVKGMSALTRAGVTFNQAEKDKVKNLIASNKILEAQEVILQAIERQVGGTASATATAASKMAQAWDNLQTSFGSGYIDDLDRLYETLAVRMNDPAVLGAFTRLGEAIGEVISQLSGEAATLGTDKIVGFVNALADALPRAVPWLRDEFVPAVKSLFDTVRNVPQTGTWVIVESLGDALSALPPSWRDDVVIIAGLLAAAGKIGSIGSGIGNLIPSGISLGGKSGIMNVQAGVVNVNGAVGTGGGVGGVAGKGITVAGLAAAAAPYVVPAAVGAIAVAGGLAGIVKLIRAVDPGADERGQQAQLDQPSKTIEAYLELKSNYKNADPGVKALMDASLRDYKTQVTTEVTTVLTTQGGGNWERLDALTRKKTIDLSVIAYTAAAEDKLSETERDRIVTLLAEGKVDEAARQLNAVTSAQYKAKIDAVLGSDTASARLEAIRGQNRAAAINVGMGTDTFSPEVTRRQTLSRLAKIDLGVGYDGVPDYLSRRTYTANLRLNPYVGRAAGSGPGGPAPVGYSSSSIQVVRVEIAGREVEAVVSSVAQRQRDSASLQEVMGVLV